MTQQPPPWTRREEEALRRTLAAGGGHLDASRVLARLGYARSVRSCRKRANEIGVMTLRGAACVAARRRALSL